MATSNYEEAISRAVKQELARFHLGSNQRRILELLKKKKNMTEREIATAIYGKPINIGDSEYVAVNKSLLSLMRRGLVERTTQEVRWNLKKTSVKKNKGL